MNPKLQMFVGIMAYIAFPVGFYYLVDKLLASNDFIVGSVISVIRCWKKSYKVKYTIYIYD